MKHLYCFKTFKSTYYFPALTEKSRFIYSLYGNYGGKAAHLLWWLFQHIGFVRWLNRVEVNKIEGYSQLMSMLGDDVVIGINMGTNGPDQKKSILGYDKNSGMPFFAKLATKERAMKLSKNEIKVYQLLADTDLVPQLFDYQITDKYVYLKCACIQGNHVYGQVGEEQVLNILLVLKEKHYSTESSATGLQTCFAHMDFCPWNMIDVQGELHIIDWEMAAEMPLGFDLFTYLLQTHFLTINNCSGNEVISQNEKYINQYFGMDRVEWQPYLHAFIDWKIDYFSAGQNDLLLNRFKEMKG